MARPPTALCWLVETLDSIASLATALKSFATPFKAVSGLQGIQSDGKGHTFLGTDAGLVELSFAARPAMDLPSGAFPNPMEHPGRSAYGIFIDGDALWYGCGLELCRMDAQGTRVLSRDSGLPADQIIAIQKDRAGNLWVTARNLGGMFVWPAGKANLRGRTCLFRLQTYAELPFSIATGGF